jgi:hypothetical protein
MKIATNHKLIQRNKRIGQYTLIASLIILALGMYLTFQNNIDYLTYSFVCLIMGFILSQVSIYYGSRFGRSPRPDELITQSLKGLEEKYIIYNYNSPVPHLLVGPAGVWLILPSHVKGVVQYDAQRKRWKHRGGNLLMGLLAQESIGRPDVDAEVLTRDAQKFVNRKLEDGHELVVKPIMVFTNERVEVTQGESPIPAMQISRLKDFFRRKFKEEPFDMEQIRALQSALPEPEK